MVNNFNDIDKTNNHLAPLTTEHKLDHDICRWKYRSLDCNRLQKETGLNQLMRSQSPCENWISNGYKQTIKILLRFASWHISQR